MDKVTHRVAEVSIPDRDLCKFQQGLPSQFVVSQSVSIPDRDLCKFQRFLDR